MLYFFRKFAEILASSVNDTNDQFIIFAKIRNDENEEKEKPGVKKNLVTQSL
jgi:hypothetical protein